MLAAAVSIALLLDSVYARAKRAMQLGLFVPYLVPSVIAAILWTYLYTPQVSPITKALSHLNVQVNFFGSAFTYPSLVNIVLWGVARLLRDHLFREPPGYSREILEAASIDGATERQCAWLIKLPLIRGAVGVTALFSIIWGLQLFAEPLVLTPFSADVSSTWSPNLYSYTPGVPNINFGLAAAYLAAPGLVRRHALVRLHALRQAMAHMTASVQAETVKPVPHAYGPRDSDVTARCARCH